MGLLDELIKQSGASAQPGAQQSPAGGSVLVILNQALQQHGGLPGLINLFQQGGVGHIISSWIGTGANLPISPEQLQQILGGDGIARISSQLGLPTEGATSSLAELLPGLVDQATPQGELPGTGDLPGTDLLGSAFSQFMK